MASNGRALRIGPRRKLSLLSMPSTWEIIVLTALADAVHAEIAAGRVRTEAFDVAAFLAARDFGGVGQDIEIVAAVEGKPPAGL